MSISGLKYLTDVYLMQAQRNSSGNTNAQQFAKMTIELPLVSRPSAANQQAEPHLNLR